MKIRTKIRTKARTKIRTRDLLIAATLVLGMTAGSTAPAFADAPGGPATAPASAGVPQNVADALTAAISQVPNDATTAVLVRVGGGDGSWQGSAGVHDLTSGREADPKARFRAGSVTKVFTAAVVLQLAAEHRVDLDRPVRDYLPDLIPPAYGKVTVRQLLNHTHGMPSADFEGDDVEDWYANRFHVYTPEEMVASALSEEKEAQAVTPGAEQHYTNIGYTVAGLLIERLTHDSYENQVTRRILAPLGLRGTSFPGADPRIHGPHNHGYQRFERADGSTELRDVSVWSATDGWAAGDIISTTADLERFIKALFRGAVVRGPLLEEMFTLPKLKEGTAAYSAGLTSFTFNGQQVWGKTGGRWGYNAGLAATRDLSRTVVYSMNSTDAKDKDRNPLIPAIALAAFPGE